MRTKTWFGAVLMAGFVVAAAGVAQESAAPKPSGEQAAPAAVVKDQPAPEAAVPHRAVRPKGNVSAPRQLTEPLPLRLQRADTNGDKVISIEEAKAAAPEITEDVLSRLDRNKDGAVSVDELPRAASGPHPLWVKFAEADKNGDGKLAPDEALAAVADFTAEKFAATDVNRDGVLTREELLPQRPEPPLRARLMRADKDGDKKVTFEEAQAAIPDITKEKFAELDRNGDGVFGTEDMASLRTGSPVISRLLEADKDGDKKITLEEAQAAMPQLTQQRFDALDQNHDGAITPEDEKAAGPRTRRMPQLKPREGAEGSFLKGAPGARGSGLMQQVIGADANGDGKTTHEEALKALPNLPAAEFAGLDKNKDGVVSQEDAK